MNKEIKSEGGGVCVCEKNQNLKGNKKKKENTRQTNKKQTKQKTE